ncbi:hypothetical protein U1Q18_024975 [Sarracenia purpurea var. burkii]
MVRERLISDGNICWIPKKETDLRCHVCELMVMEMVNYVAVAGVERWWWQVMDCGGYGMREGKVAEEDNWFFFSRGGHNDNLSVIPGL